MSSLLKIALVMSLIDKVSAPLGKVDDAVTRNGQAVKGLAERFGGLARQMESVRHVGRGLAVAGLAAGGLMGLGSVPADAARAEHALRALGNVGDLTNQQLSDMGRDLLATSKETNQTLAELIQGTKTLVSAGLDPRIATRFMPTIGKAATATQATVDDLSKTLFSVYDNLQVPETKLMQAVDTLAASGKSGKFELDNMARYFPMLTAGARSLQMQGVPAVAQLGAALQIAMRGAGTPEEAATNLQNFLQKITSKETVKNFAKFGVNVEQEMKKATEKGLDPIEHMLNVIMGVTGGNKFKLAEIFGDMQVTNFLVPMMKDLADYRAIRDKTMTASGVVDKDFQAMMGTTIEQWKALKITMAKIVMPNLAGPLSAVNGVLKVLTGNAVLAKMTFYGIALAIGGGGLLMTLGGIGAALPKVAAGWTMMARARAFFMATEKVGVFGEIIRTASPASVWLGRVATAMKAVRAATLLTGGAVIAAAVAIGAAVYQIWKHWDTLKQPGFFRDLRNWILDETLLGQFFKAGVNIVRSIWQGITSLASKPVEALRAIADKMRRLLPFSPAKDGPLRDIHRIRLVETIAQAIRPAPMVRAMAGVVGATAGALSGGMSMAGGGGVHVTYSPTINLNGASGSVKEELMGVLRQHKDELLRLIEGAQQKRDRVKF